MNTVKNNNDKNFRSKWGNRFIIAAIIQGGIMTGMALVTVALQLLITDVDIIQFLSLSFEGPAKWFFIGIIFYMILIVAIAVTAVLLGMNIGGPCATILMIFAGLAGSGVLSLFIEGKLGQEDIGIMTSFIPPIAFFILLLSIGVICGGMTYVMAYRSKA